MAVNNARKNLEERLRRGHAFGGTDLDAAEQLQKALGTGEAPGTDGLFRYFPQPGPGDGSFHGGVPEWCPQQEGLPEVTNRPVTEGKPDDFKSMEEVV